MTLWIPVSERLPECAATVLIHHPNVVPLGEWCVIAYRVQMRHDRSGKPADTYRWHSGGPPTDVYWPDQVSHWAEVTMPGDTPVWLAPSKGPCEKCKSSAGRYGVACVMCGWIEQESRYDYEPEPEPEMREFTIGQRVLAVIDAAPIRTDGQVLTTREIMTKLDIPIEELHPALQEMLGKKVVEGRMMSPADPLYSMEWRRWPR